jgi:hypothetical protein
VQKKCRRGTREESLEAACIYLNFASREIRPAGLSVAKCFHYAANELLQVSVFQRSAECYYLSAVAAYKCLCSSNGAEDQDMIDLALRSAGRAKAQYSALCVDDLAADAHSLQQEIQRIKYCKEGDRGYALLWRIWREFTVYGTSFKRWLSWLVLCVVSFALVYEILICDHAIGLANSAHHSWMTSLYLSVINLVAFGGYTQIIPLSPISEAVLMVQAFASFLLVGTGFTFLSRR